MNYFMLLDFNFIINFDVCLVIKYGVYVMNMLID